MKNILVFGAGLVARPLLRYLLTQFDFRVVVATLDEPRGRALLGDHPRGRVLTADATDPGQAVPLVAEADVVVSLLPAELNPNLARLCLGARRPMVNTSYASQEMWGLDEEARSRGVLLLNEMGLDPGIDHMSAVELVRRVKSVGGTVRHFSSCCGGFPAPDANTNPWGYKFSWSPRAVILAGRRPARFLRGGREVDVPGPELFANSWPYEIEGQGIFEIYPNRDSIRYVGLYGLEGAEGVIRGTIRYPGWCATMKAAADLGMFDVDVRNWTPGTTYGEFLTRLLPPGSGSLPRRVADFLGISEDSEVVARLEWAGLFSDRLIPEVSASPLDVFGNRLTRLMMYQPGERDMVALRHLLTVTYPDGSREEIRSLLVRTGEPWGDSAMARCVSLPAGIATRLILAGGFTAVGVHIPVLREMYEPVLEELEERGIALQERHFRTLPGPLHTS